MSLLYNSLVNHYFHQSLCRVCVWITGMVWQFGEVGFPLTGAGATVLTLADGTLLNMHTPGSPTTGPAHQLRDKKDGESPFVHDWSWQENLEQWRALGGCFLGGHFGGRFSRCCLFIWIKVLGRVGCHGFGLVGTIMASGRLDITHNHYAIIIHLLSMLVFPTFVS